MTAATHHAAVPTVRLSVIVITKNEAARLPTCLASVAFADELVVVDSASTDNTVELARGFGARVKIGRASCRERV